LSRLARLSQRLSLSRQSRPLRQLTSRQLSNRLQRSPLKRLLPNLKLLRQGQSSPGSALRLLKKSLS
jgi:hypothetical protein